MFKHQLPNRSISDMYCRALRHLVTAGINQAYPHHSPHGLNIQEGKENFTFVLHMIYICFAC